MDQPSTPAWPPPTPRPDSLRAPVRGVGCGRIDVRVERLPQLGGGGGRRHRARRRPRGRAFDADRRNYGQRAHCCIRAPASRALGWSGRARGRLRPRALPGRARSRRPRPALIDAGGSPFRRPRWSGVARGHRPVGRRGRRSADNDSLRRLAGPGARRGARALPRASGRPPCSWC